METELAKHLISLGVHFSEAKSLEETTVGRLCASDGRFFIRIRQGKTFTAKKYDDVVAWFSTNWPDDTAWPVDVPQPEERAA